MAQDKTTDDPILQISPVGDLTGLVEAAKQALNHFGCREIWFRGHADASWHLSPVLFRPECASAQERRLSQLFMRDAPIRYANCPGNSASEAFDWLSLMRHYGLPTRLLDWSTSIQVAAHFAVSAPDDESDAAIWVLQGDSLSACHGPGSGLYHPVTPVVAGIAQAALNGGEIPEVVLPVIPTAFDLRMLVQQSRFTIHGSRMPLEDLSQAGRYLAKITIPKKDARKILRNALRLLGTRGSALFPDLDSLAKELAASESTPENA